MKKIAAFFIALFLLIQPTTMAFYLDVPEDHPYYAPIKALFDANRLPMNTNFFEPDRTLTNSDLYSLLVAFGQLPEAEIAALPYKDTDNNADYAKYLQTAIDKGILTPSSTNFLFSPDQKIAKHQVLSTLFQYLGIGVNYFFDQSSFPFTDLSADSKIAALAVTTNSIGIKEKNEKVFRMAKRPTKGEVANYLYKIYKTSSAPKLTVTFKSNATDIESLNENLQFNTFENIWNLLHTKYFYNDSLNDDDLLVGAIQGMLSVINDPYTVFTLPDETNIKNMLSSEFEGIGVQIEDIDGKLTIISPLKDSPAEKEGLKPNDIILEIDGQSTKGKSIEWASSKIRGKSGTKVKLKIQRGETEKTYNITREFIINQSVTYELLQENDKKIAYLDVVIFSDTVDEQFTENAKQALKDDTDGFLIDVRNNPGGYTDPTINMLSLFTKEVRTLLTFVFSDNSKKAFSTNGNGLLDGYKIVVLVNEGSASASEIFAGALQDFGIATVVGTTTFGKGSVQQFTTYKDGSVFKYTMAHWLTPNGTDINAKGIKPDVIIKDDPATETDEQLNKALAQF